MSSRRRLVCAIRLWRGRKEDTASGPCGGGGVALVAFPGLALRGQPRELGPDGGGPAVAVECRPRAALPPWPERGP